MRTNLHFRKVSIITSLFILATYDASQARAEEAVALYVAVDGNDAWSGRLARRTPLRATGRSPRFSDPDEIRRLKQAGPLPPGGIAVELAAASTNDEPLDPNPQDQGPKAPIVYRVR